MHAWYSEIAPPGIHIEVANADTSWASQNSKAGTRLVRSMGWTSCALMLLSCPNFVHAEGCSAGFKSGGVSTGLESERQLGST